MLEILRKLEVALKRMDSFFRTKKNMFLLIRDGIQDALYELSELRRKMEYSFEYLLRGRIVQIIKEISHSKMKDVVDEGTQTSPKPAPRFTPERRKRQQEPTVSPQENVTKKPEK